MKEIKQIDEYGDLARELKKAAENEGNCDSNSCWCGENMKSGENRNHLDCIIA